MKISLEIDNKETSITEWNCVPRVDEYVVSSDGRRYRVTGVVHKFYRGIDSADAEIVLCVEDAPE